MEYGLKHRITAMILMVCLFFNQCGLVAFANDVLEGIVPDANLTIVADDGSDLTQGVEYNWKADSEGKILYILSDKDMTISQDKEYGIVYDGQIQVVSGTKANITLDNVNIQSEIGVALYVEGAKTDENGNITDVSAELNLTVEGENTLKSGKISAGIQLNDSNAKITIKGDSDAVLNAYGYGGGAGIGGAKGASGGNVIIAGDLTINAEGGAVMEESSVGEDGTQYYTIAAQADGIGAGAQSAEDTSKGTFSIDADNQPIVNVTSMDTTLLTEGVTSGMIFNGYQGKIYGTEFTRDVDYSIPNGKTLVVEADTTLTVAENTTLTIPEHSEMVISGTVVLDGTVVESPQAQQDVRATNEAGTIVNNGAVSLTENATLTIPTGATFENNGTINLATGAEIDGDVTNGENATVEKETALTFKIEKKEETTPETTPDTRTTTEEETTQEITATGTYVITTTVTADGEEITLDDEDIKVYYKLTNESDFEYQALITSSDDAMGTSSDETKEITKEFSIGDDGAISANGLYDIKVVYGEVAEASTGAEVTYKSSQAIKEIKVNDSSLPSETITTLSIANDDDSVEDGKASEGDTLTLTAKVTETDDTIAVISGTVTFTIVNADDTTDIITIPAEDVDTTTGVATATIKIAEESEADNGTGASSITDNTIGYIEANGTYTITATYSDDNRGDDYVSSSDSTDVTVTGFATDGETTPEEPTPPTEPEVETPSTTGAETRLTWWTPDLSLSKGNTAGLIVQITNLDTTFNFVTEGTVTFTIEGEDSEGNTIDADLYTASLAPVNVSSTMATATLNIDDALDEYNGFLGADGTYTITATYNGVDEKFKSSSATTTIVVSGFTTDQNVAETSTALRIYKGNNLLTSITEASKDDTLSFVAGITPVNNAGGTVTFIIQGIDIENEKYTNSMTIPVQFYTVFSNATATVQVADLIGSEDGFIGANGTYYISAFYSGVTGEYLPSNAETSTLTVTGFGEEEPEEPEEDDGKIKTTTALYITDDSQRTELTTVAKDDTFTMTAMVSAEDDETGEIMPDLDGSIQFEIIKDNVTVKQVTKELDNKQANATVTVTYESFTTDTNIGSDGDYIIKATYLGNDDYSTSNEEKELEVTGFDNELDESYEKRTTVTIEMRDTDEKGDIITQVTDDIEKIYIQATIEDSDGKAVIATTDNFTLSYKLVSAINYTDVADADVTLTAGIASATLEIGADKDISAYGGYLIQAYYEGTLTDTPVSGETYYTPSVGYASLTYAKPTDTAIESDAKDDKAEDGDTVTLTATVTNEAGELATTGTVTFTLELTDGTGIAYTRTITANVVDGVATATLDIGSQGSGNGYIMVNGTYAITATYSGDSTYATSSDSMELTVSGVTEPEKPPTEEEEEEEEEYLGDRDYTFTIIKNGYLNGSEGEEYHPAGTEEKTTYTFNEGDIVKITSSLGTFNNWYIADEEQSAAFVEANINHDNSNYMFNRTVWVTMPACDIEIGAYGLNTLYLQDGKVTEGTVSNPTTNVTTNLTTGYVKYAEELTVIPSFTTTSQRFTEWAVTGAGAEEFYSLNPFWNIDKYEEELTFVMPDETLNMTAQSREVTGHTLTPVNATTSPAANAVSSPFTVTEGEVVKLYGVAPYGTTLQNVSILPAIYKYDVNYDSISGNAEVTMPAEDVQVTFEYWPTDRSDLLKVVVENGYISDVSTTGDYSYVIGQSVAYLPSYATVTIQSLFDGEQQHDYWTFDSMDSVLGSGALQNNTGDPITFQIKNSVTITAKGKAFTPSLSFGKIANGNNNVESAEILTVNGVAYTGTMNGDGAYEIATGSLVTILANTDLNPNVTGWTVLASDPSGAITSNDIEDVYYPTDTATNPSAKNWAQFTMPKAHIELIPAYNTSTATLTVNSGLATTTTYINKDINVTANSAISGKKFAYWYVSDTTKLNLSDKTNINDATTIFNITGDVTVTATYVDSSTELYTLTVIAGNPLDTAMNASSYTYTANYPAGATQTVFPPTAYTSQFVRWEIYPTNSNTDKTYSYDSSYRFTMTSYDLTIQACYKEGGTSVIRTLTIDQEGANPDTYTEKYIAGDTVRVTAQSISGYVFQYWSSDPLSDGTYVGFYQPTSSSTVFDMPDQDTRVMAIMEKDISKYNVSVYNGSGDGLYYVGDRVEIVASPAEDGFTFLNWSTTSNISIDNVNATESYFYMIAEDVKITAIYIDENDASNVYKVTVLSGEGNGLHTVTGNYLPGATVTISSQGSITDDRTFYQWTSSTNSITLKNSLSSVTSFIMPAEDLVLTATYKYLPDHDYSIMVYNGESDPVGLAKENDVVTLTANATPPTTGYVFSHWSSNSTNIVYNNNQASITEFIMPPEDVVITANYRDPNLVTYLATIHTHGAMAQTPTTIRYAESDTVQIQAATAVDGMKFINWSSMNNVIFDNEFSESTSFKMPAYDVTVQANFSENSLDVYTATIINQQNGDYTTGRYISGTTVTIEAGAATSGAFDYWSSESAIEFADKTTMVTTFVMPEKDIVVKANYKSSWELIYRATVQNGDGDGDYAQGDTVTVSAKPTGDQVFSYWSVDDDSVTFVNKYRDTTTFKMPSNDVKVVAHYEEGSSNEYTVTVTKGLGSGTYEPGDTVHLEATEEDGEVFSYWSVVSGTGVQIRSQYSRVTSFRMPDSEVRITAVYTNGTSGGDSGANGSYDAPYTITTTVMGSGQIYPSGTVRAYQYGSQKFLMVPETGFETAIVLVDGKVADATSEYTFSNITENHTINVVFRTASLNTNAPGTTGSTTNLTNPFMDVTQADWFYDTIMDVYAKGIMSGTSVSTFEPNTGASRAMVATVLYGLENAPVVTSHDVFTDITTSEWYTNGVIWCYQNNILSGYDDGTFKPTQLITREELCAILYRYGQYKDLDMTILGDINQFADSNSISTWAQTAVKWCIGNSLMSGRKIWEFDPKSQATRAEIAVVFSNATNLTHKFDR